VNPANDAEETLVMTLTGASLGGVGTLTPDHLSSSIELGKVFPHCEITLPHLGSLDTSLSVKHMTETVMLNGSKKYKVGFQFVGLSRTEERYVQQYVLQLEREALTLAKGG